MIVTDIYSRTTTEYCELSAVIKPETPGISEQKVWFRFPPKFEPYVSKTGDPFLAVALLPAMILGENLTISSPVSKFLLENTHQIQAIFHQWVKGAQVISIQSEEYDPVSPSSNATGCFFSGGVDSFYSLLKNKEAITHLILIIGFDRGLNSLETIEETRVLMSEVASTTGKTLIEVNTNLRSFGDAFLSWDYYHGSVLAGTALALQQLFKNVIIPASISYDYLFPWGTHPLLDPLWSNGNTQIIHDGCEATRFEKVTKWISHSELALKTLRVCWQKQNSNYNCGICEKCLRTMLALEIAGKLSESETFPKTLNPNFLRALRFNKYDLIQLAMENLDGLEARKSKKDKVLIRFLRSAIRHSLFKTAFKIIRNKAVFK